MLRDRQDDAGPNTVVGGWRYRSEYHKKKLSKKQKSQGGVENKQRVKKTRVCPEPGDGEKKYGASEGNLASSKVGARVEY